MESILTFYFLIVVFKWLLRNLVVQSFSSFVDPKPYFHYIAIFLKNRLEGSVTHVVSPLSKCFFFPQKTEISSLKGKTDTHLNWQCALRLHVMYDAKIRLLLYIPLNIGNASPSFKKNWEVFLTSV